MPQPSPQTVTRATASAIALVTVAFTAEPAAYWLEATPPPTISAVLFATITVAAFVITALRVVWDAACHGAGGNRRLLDLAICASAAFTAPLGFGPAWLALPALLSGYAVIALSPRRSLVVVPLIIVMNTLIAAVEMTSAGGFELADVVTRTAVTTVVIGAVGWLAHFLQEVFRSRAELAHLAVVEERLRFARDLHDVLGHALSVIGLKNEVALQLIERNPQRAAAEIDEARRLAAEAVRDLRRLVRGYRNPALADEVAGVRGILELAGIECAADAVPLGLPDHVQQVAGWIVRESGTNILRHAKATTCAIKMRVSNGELFVEIVNDGAPGHADAGSGLAGLGERVAAVGGTFSFFADQGRFTVRANLPLTQGARP